MTKKNIKHSLFHIALFFLISCNSTDILTRSEKEWLLQHPNLTVGISTNGPPYQFLNDKGETKGIFIDFLSIIEKQIDYKFKRTYEYDYTKLLNDTKEGRVDVLVEIQRTDERETYLKFTPFLLSHNHVIVTRVSQQEIKSINDLKDKKIAVCSSHAVHQYLSIQHPEFKLTLVPESVDGLRAVSTDQVDVFICQQGIATYHIQNEGISNLKIVGEVNYSNELAIASRKSLDTLNTILTKAVNSITKKEKQRIYNNWLSYTVKPFYLETNFLLIVSALVLFILFFAFLFNYILRKKVKQKTLELLKAKEQAEENETFLTNIFENIPNMVFIKGVDDLRFIRINKAGEKLLGYKSEELIGKNDYDFFPKEEADFFTSKDREVFKTDEPLIIEEESISTKFGIKKLHTKKISLKDKKGNHKFLLGISEDITKKIETQRELKEAKEKAQESDQLKSAFLANMSHEIRTPMNGILGFAGLLKEPHLTDKEQQKYIQIIEKSGARMLSIINDIVSISKIEAGIVDNNLSETNINNQLQFVYDSLKLDADHKNLNLSFTCELPEKEAIITTDSEKFYGILSNLVKNAIKYTDEGTIEFGYVNKAEEVEFYVKDTGIGISKEKTEVIFERFIQADIADKMARQGAGLGLAISRAYVEILGGRIWVESEEAKGSTFFFTLPCNINSEEQNDILIKNIPENETQSIMSEVSDLKVLIAEDDETSEMLISIELKKFCKEMHKATTGIEAVEICRKNPDIDFVLMDIQMPKMNGYQATREIRKFNKNVIIIAQTAFALAGDKDKAIEAGCNDYITKPINKMKLQEMIQRYFGE